MEYIATGRKDGVFKQVDADDKLDDTLSCKRGAWLRLVTKQPHYMGVLFEQMRGTGLLNNLIGNYGHPYPDPERKKKKRLTNQEPIEREHVDENEPKLQTPFQRERVIGSSSGVQAHG